MWFCYFRAGSVEEEDRYINSEPELDKALLGLVERQGSAEFMSDPDKGSLTIGVTDDRAYLSFDPRSNPGPYMVIRSDTCQSDELLVFNMGNTATEVEQRHCIPIEDMKEIVRHFYRTKELLDFGDGVWEVDPG